MTILYSAGWVVPISSPPIRNGAVAIDGSLITAVGDQAVLAREFPEASRRSFDEAVIFPGLVNSHSHLELTAMRGFLDHEEGDFFSWLKKLTTARLERMTPDDLYVSAAWGACEALRAGVTFVADASDAAHESMNALRDVGLRGTVYQESFGPDPRLARENFETLKAKVASLRSLETPLVRVGVSPHAPYSVCPEQLEMIAAFALTEKLPVMMHAAESIAEDRLLREGQGSFAEGLARREIQWSTPSRSTIQHLARHGILQTRPLLAHCINVDRSDIELMAEAGAGIAHCPKSNAKFSHHRAPFVAFLESGIAVGLGSDSVASNNTCDLLEEARFALLLARSGTDGRGGKILDAETFLRTATSGGARAVGHDDQTGELRVGLQADLAIVSLAGTHQQPSQDPVGTLIFSSSGRDVLLTVVAGRELFRDGRLQEVDEERLRARINEIGRKLVI